ncbi:C2H2 type zinc finger domain-containing protein [Macroventuria anomochaeta]|uniref:C2H2 type zinc finger domain-containing protein n=1 Tax=Macroventuria anomochaeta TaxID=301207 RepID=A0ACB6S478_9PLEO|nr:C2H2 type zinc finger domain-containing protein [Macroventuria anomochaeta]KAF2629060.1 C2H2 type zinc finger domain-containing protein [Macroventuria anomochaeta]
MNDVYLEEANADAQALLDLYNTTDYNQHTIPAFFEQIMVPAPDFMGVDYMQPPPDLTAWMPEVDWLGQVDIFGNDFTPVIDQMLEAQVSHDVALPSETQPPNVTDTSHEKIDSNSAKRRHAVFKQSPWFWVPERNQHAFSEHENITLDERNVDLASSPHMPYSSNVVIPDRLSTGARDRIFQLVSKTARSQITIPSFPSADCVDKLIKVGIAKRTETDAWIHPYTFESETARPEYLTALVAAGCVCFGIPSVSRTGLALQEIVRVALNNLSENDNSVIRDLEYLQASMLWLDIGAFCGYRRKMEIAESSLQPLVTALRRAGRLDYVRYPAVAPSAEDGEEELHAKWKQWVEQESYKRLAYHLFEHDIHMTMVKHRPPLITYAELTLALPASKALWLASSAEIWRTRYLEMDISSNPPSLRAILKDEAAILCLHLDIDVQIARSSYLHGIAAQIWEHAQQSVLLHESSDPSSQLWARSRQQKLYQRLQREDFLLSRSPAVTCVLHQFLQMFLHVNLDLITRFAGKCGESAANSAYTHLSPWSQTKEARIAICHAGQVVRAARHIPPYQIRGPDSFMLYHAIMVLWTYSMMVRDRAKKTGTTTPMLAQPSSPPSKIVYLDDAASYNQSDIDSFILMNSGTPCLHIISTHQSVVSESGAPKRPEICNLKYPSQVMKVGVRLLDATHPDVDRETGPPLMRALCGLMEELGGLR